jgi:hypothetical protein
MSIDCFVGNFPTYTWIIPIVMKAITLYCINKMTWHVRELKLSQRLNGAERRQPMTQTLAGINLNELRTYP